MGSGWLASSAFVILCGLVCMGPCGFSLTARLPADLPAQPCFPLPAIMSSMIRWLSCRKGTMRGLALFSGEPKVKGVNLGGIALLSMSSVACLCPFSPFKALCFPPTPRGYMSWFGTYWGTRQWIPLLLAFHFLVGISAPGETEIFLLRVNVEVHRGMYSHLDIPTCCLSHPIAMP
jgi:hypothetical protein